MSTELVTPVRELADDDDRSHPVAGGPPRYFALSEPVPGVLLAGMALRCCTGQGSHCGASCTTDGTIVIHDALAVGRADSNLSLVGAAGR
jgi:hypothetical protein